MTGADWDKLIAKLPEGEAAEYAAALAKLREFKPLHKEFGWTGLWWLQTSFELRADGYLGGYLGEEV